MAGEMASLVDEATIGDTPLIELPLDCPPTVFAKLEWFNLYSTPYGGGSIKSRIAQSMLDAAESEGYLPGRTVIEPSSGNTGSELAKLGAKRGYPVEIVMPDNASHGKIATIRDAGATIHFVPASEGYDAVLAECARIVDNAPEKYFRPNQYTNPANPRVHRETTATEIWTQTDGTITYFIAGVGTGGTVTGTGRGLKDRRDVHIVGFEPKHPLHAIDGLKYLRTGDHYHPETYDVDLLDSRIYIETSHAYDQARNLYATYNSEQVIVHDSGQYAHSVVRDHLRVETRTGEQAFLVGTSSGAAVQAVHQLVEDNGLTTDDKVVVIFADRGDKYTDIPLWNDLF